MRARGVMRGVMSVLAMAALVGCTQDPEGVRQSSHPAGEEVAGETGEVHGGDIYDPGEDPLVNPERIFQAAPEDRSKIAEDETLVFNLGANPNSLNPIFFSSVQDGIATGLLYTDPFTLDHRMNWGVNEHIVESWQEAEDHLSFTLTLKPGLTWHDGQPLTAEDIRFSWEAILDDRVPAPAVKPGTDKVSEVEVVDTRTVRYHFEEALPTNKWNMGFPIIPRHIYGDAEQREQDPSLMNSDYYNRHNRREVVGSGPYRLVEWIPNDRIVVERWDGFKGRRPHFKRIILKIQEDPNTSLLLFRKRQMDVTGLNAQQFATQTGDAEFGDIGRKALGSSWSFSYIGWNMDGSNPFFGDVRVRRAMAHAFDREKIIRDVFYNLARPCHGIYHPDSWMFNPEVKQVVLRYDPERAARLLAEAGWRISQEDGLRYKTIDGHKVKFQFELLIPQGADSSVKLAAIYAEDLRSLGILMNTRVLEWAAFQKLTHSHQFEAEISGWGTGADPDMGWNIWRTEMYQQGRNFGGYSNPQVDRLFERGRDTFGRENRAGIYRQIHKIIYLDQPYLFIINPPSLAAVHKRLRGLRFSPRGLTGFTPGMTGWWVPAGMQMR